MKQVMLSPELSLSAIVQGFWRLDRWNLTTPELVRLMNTCIDMGVTTFDTAEVYGGAEEKMGLAFAADPTIRPRIQLVSKTGIYKQIINGKPFGYYDTRKDRILRSCRDSLKKLHTDHLDLYLIHRGDPLLDPRDTAEALLQLQKEGLIRRFGVSNFDPHQFEALNAATGGLLVTNQIEWNPLCFEHFDTGMVDYLTLHRIHPMIWSPLAGGRLFTGEDEGAVRARGKITEIAQRHGVEPAVIAYAWILHHPMGAIPLVGSHRPDRLQRAVQALDVRLERWEWFEIYSASGQKRVK